MCLDSPRALVPTPTAASQRGMTLIELLIVMAVAVLLASIAIPSYQSYVTKARRADARGALTTVAQMLERFSTENSSTYPTTAQFAAQFPAASENLYYTLAINRTATTFTLSAVPAAGKSQASDPCGTFTLTQNGQRGIVPPVGSTKTAGECWQ